MEYGDERLPQRFWDKTIPEPMSGCWLWTAASKSGDYGYGVFATRKGEGWGMTIAHRVSYAAEHGDIEPGVVIDHVCHTPACVNPAHLRAGSVADNVRNMRHRPSRTSRFKGVSWHKRAKKWVAQIGIDHTTHYLGVYVDDKDAARAYDTAAREHFGEFAYTNESAGLL
jgi:hypothetical protein